MGKRIKEGGRRREGWKEGWKEGRNIPHTNDTMNS